MAEVQLDLKKFVYRREHNPEDAEDVVQETQRRCLTGLPEFRARTLPAFRKWVFSIGRNVLREHINAMERERRLHEPMIEGRLAGANTPERHETPTGESSVARLRAAMARLGEEHQEIVVLYYMEARSLKQIAALLGINYNTAATRSHRARQALRRLLVGGPDHD